MHLRWHVHTHVYRHAHRHVLRWRLCAAWGVRGDVRGHVHTALAVCLCLLIGSEKPKERRGDQQEPRLPEAQRERGEVDDSEPRAGHV